MRLDVVKDFKCPWSKLPEDLVHPSGEYFERGKYWGHRGGACCGPHRICWDLSSRDAFSLKVLPLFHLLAGSGGWFPNLKLFTQLRQ